MSGLKSPAKQHVNRRVRDYDPGTLIYNYRFRHPQFGWVGGRDDEDWSDKQSTVEVLMSHCQWPTELIERVA